MQISERIVSFVAKIKEKYAIVGVYGSTQTRTTIDEREELQFIEQLRQPLTHNKKIILLFCLVILTPTWE